METAMEYLLRRVEALRSENELLRMQVGRDERVISASKEIAKASLQPYLSRADLKTLKREVVAEGTVLHAQASRRTREGKGQWRKTA